MKAAERVALNTLIHYVQLVLTVLIGLITVRVILKSLGTVDYGVYNLLGGVITLLSFISNSLSQTSIRFISVSLGTGDKQKVRDTFDSCFSLHLFIAIGLVLILEVVGLFLFDGFLDIPADRIRAAKIVYHSMVFNLFLNITVTPVRGVIVAHERFIYTSVVGVLDSICKLVIAFLVARATVDKLGLYGILMACISVLNFILFAGYVLVKFPDEYSIGKFDWKEIRKVTGFAGWTLFDVLGSMINRQGYAVVLNKFFGPVANAVYALAGQVEGHLFSISSSVVNTIKPQIMKSHGGGDTPRALRLSMTAGKFGFSMMALISIPMLVMMPEVLDLWLDEVPEGTVFFSRMMVIACMIEQLTRGLVHANQAIGNIKLFSITVSCIRMLALPVSLVLFICGCDANVSMVVFVLFETLGSFSRVIVMKHIAGLQIRDFVDSSLLQILPPFFISLVSGFFLYKFMRGPWGMLAVTAISALIYVAAAYFMGLTREEKVSVHTVADAFMSRFGIRKKEK